MIEPDPPQVQVERVGGGWRRILVVIGTITAVLVVAIAKPWDAPAQPQPTSAPPVVALAPVTPPARPSVAVATPAAATPASPTLAPSPAVPAALAAAQARLLCESEPVWRLLTMETGTLGTSRTLYNEQAAAAHGPDDQQIATVDVTADQLLGIGVCRPDQLDEQDGTAPVAGVTIWRIASDGTASAVPGLTTIDVDLSRLGEAYFKPQPSAPQKSAEPDGSWDPGRYVVEISPSSGGGPSLWMALDFSSIGTASAQERVN